MSSPMAGTQYRIELDGYAAEIASVGASIRMLQHDGRDLVVPYPEDAIRPVYRGALLVPWPNRVVDGHYAFDGQDLQLPITEVARHHALHGLAAWDDWQLVKHTETAVTLRHAISARDGYPFQISVLAVFGLTEDGLACSVTAMNTGTARAPYGVGPHPYLTVGDRTPLDDLVLALPASTVLQVTPDRLIPTETADVADLDGGALDFREPRAIGSTFIDHAYTGLGADDAGQAVVTLANADGLGTRMVWESRVCPWVQIHTADNDIEEFNRAGLAVEPMTCPPDAFNSGTDLVVIEPGHAHTASWLIGAVG